MNLPGILIGSGLIARLFNWIESELGPQFPHDKLKRDDFYYEKKKRVELFIN